MADLVPPPPTTVETGPHLMRISTQGHLKNYVAFALKFLQENPPRPLTLHTFPPSQTPGQPIASTSTSKSKARSNTPHLVPKLISTVEIVKREYLALLAQEIEKQRFHLRELAKGKGKAKDVSMEGEEEEEETEGGMRGLWQYNETGCLEDLEEVDGAGEEGERDEVREAELALERLKEVLSGKVGPKMIHTPYFKVTLSTVPLPELARRKRISSQHIVTPSRPNRTKSQARRKRKALAKAAVVAVEDSVVVASAEGSNSTSAAVGGGASDGSVVVVGGTGAGVGAKKGGAGGGKKSKGKRVADGVVAGVGEDREMESPSKKRKNM